MKVKIIILMLLALFPNSLTLAAEIVLVADPWPPYNMELGGDQEGYIVDVARKVFETAGNTLIYKTVPWKRAIEGTRSGIYSGTIGVVKDEARDFVFPDEGLGQDIITFYVRQNSVWKFEGPASIEHVSIGVADGYDYRDWLNKYIQTYSGDEKRVQVISGIDPLKQNLYKLLNKRIDVLVGNEDAIRYKAKLLGFENKIKSAGSDKEPALIYIAFSPSLKESPALARQLSDGIRELRRSGRLKTILDRYGLLDWESP